LFGNRQAALRLRLNNANIGTVNASVGPSGTNNEDAGRFWWGWQHIVITVSRTADGMGNYAYIYQNGVEVGSSSDSDFGTTFTDPDDIIKYFSFNANPFNYSPSQCSAAFRDFWMFKRKLTENEVLYIFNNDISHQPVLRSTDSDMLLWYRFVETSGVPLRSWARFTPTGTLTSGDPIDSYLYHYNDPDNGIDRIAMFDLGGPGSDPSGYPWQWGRQEDQPKRVASGNTLSLYHALRGESIDDTTVTQALSGNFTLGFWFSFETLHEADQRLPFSFDRGDEDPGSFALGFHTYTEYQHRFGFNKGTGSNNYIYNTSLNGSGYGWNHVALVKTQGADGEGKYARIYINGELGGTSANPDWDNMFAPYFLTFFNNHNPWEDNQFRGAIKDFVFYNTAMTASKVQALYDTGVFLITTTTSGGWFTPTEENLSGVAIGGYYLGENVCSGQYFAGNTFGEAPHPFGTWLGGYFDGFTYESSGIVGGYYLGRSTCSGQKLPNSPYGDVCGGWYHGVSGERETIGGFIHSSGVESGIIGGYVFGFLRESGVVGGYVHGALRQSGVLGGFISCADLGSGIADASFRVKAVAVSDFDALVEVKSTYRGDFDGFIEVYKAETPPDVTIIQPPTDVSGVDTPYTPWLVGSGVPYNDKTIVQATWNFGDLTPEEAGVASGTNIYATTHTYNNSGIYIVNLKMVDSKGLVGNGTRLINLASGVPMPDVELTANPRSGNAPLTVDFDYTITNLPAGVTITSKVLYFGNGKSTLNPNVNYTYTEPGVYTPILCVLDSRGIVTCDSLHIGVNN